MLYPFKRNSFRLWKNSEWPNVTFLPQTIHHAFHSIQLIIWKPQSPRSTTRSKNKARYFWTRKNNKATLPSLSRDGENNGSSYNHGQSTLVSPRARNWNARVECPIGSPASSCRRRSKRKVSSVSSCKKPGYRASSIPLYLPLSLSLFLFLSRPLSSWLCNSGSWFLAIAAQVSTRLKNCAHPRWRKNRSRSRREQTKGLLMNRVTELGERHARGFIVR